MKTHANKRKELADHARVKVAKVTFVAQAAATIIRCIVLLQLM